MTLYVYFTCGIEKCPYSKKIVPATKAEIILHLKKHDYKILLEESLKYRLIKNITERRNPQWLAENLTDLFMNEIDE